MQALQHNIYSWLNKLSRIYKKTASAIFNAWSSSFYSYTKHYDLLKLNDGCGSFLQPGPESSESPSSHLAKLLTKIAKRATRIPLLVTKMDCGEPEKFTLCAWSLQKNQDTSQCNKFLSIWTILGAFSSSNLLLLNQIWNCLGPTKEKQKKMLFLSYLLNIPFSLFFFSNFYK